MLFAVSAVGHIVKGRLVQVLQQLHAAVEEVEVLLVVGCH